MTLPVTVAVLTGPGLAAAVEISRDDARRDAARELSKRMYAGHRPSLLGQLIGKVLEWVTAVLDRASQVAPGGVVGLITLVGLLLLALIAVRLRIGPLARSSTALFDADAAGRPMTAAEHRARADAFAAAEHWADAIRERMRAIVRDLEARGVLDRRPGRTAREVAEQAGAVLPGAAAELTEAAALFDEVWYGGRAATAAADTRMQASDARIRAARPILAGTTR